MFGKGKLAKKIEQIRIAFVSVLHTGLKPMPINLAEGQIILLTLDT